MSEAPPQKLPPEVWVVVPAYNEAARLAATLENLLAVASTVVVVDDGSPDDTARVAAQYPVWVLRHVVNLGQGAAIQTGITFSLRQGAEYVATFDADGQHVPGDLLRLHRALREKQADFALGSRFLGRAEGIPWTRTLMLKAAVFFTWVFSGIRVTDTHNGIRMMTRRGAEKIRITMNRMEHASEILDQIAASGLRFVEVPVTIRYSTESLAKGQRSSAAVRLALKLFAERLAR
ncbi:MAG: glycosyltransferase family 2 protein [Bryobacteraceae bacterium]